ncbi:hypothetical protein PVK06_001388 [Gossypium arboreum]|uniref:Uncharacterized protein n=1 Tax=Gossypium arboreum TaxID=29729 RepID=A0ABR0R1Y2_GOSAR|nr:hypothetical protein PVK06_001388 [Gossypium arboreum]
MARLIMWLLLLDFESMILADYGNILTDIISDWPLLAKSSLPENFFYSHFSDESTTLSISGHISRLILVLSANSIAKRVL